MTQPKINPLSSFEEHKLQFIWQTPIPILFRVRMFVIPLLIFFLGLFILYKEPLWKILLLFIFLVIISFIIVYDFYTFEKIPKTENRLFLAILIIPIGQLLIIFLTGGIESPFLFIIFPLIFIFNVLFSQMRYGFIFSFIYLFGIFILGFGVYFDILPNAAPSFLKLHNHFKSNPIYFWTAFTIIISMIFSSTMASRVIYNFGLNIFDELSHAREDLIQMQTDRMKDLENIGNRIAHEIKNPLVSIKGLTQLISRKKNTFDPKDQQRFQVIEEEIHRIQGILEEFSSFTRPIDDLKVQLVDVKKVLRSCLQLYEFKFSSHGITWDTEYYNENVQIMADPGKLKQIFINLFQNALDAMPNGGTISIEISGVDKRGVMVTVSDTGPGIEEKNLEKLFDPYFTTKPDGSGLGLTIARSITRQHKGELKIKSQVNKGTVATVTLPSHMDG